jgi:hypothetical protein
MRSNILRCAERPVREITVGGGGRASTLLGMIAPRLTDLIMERYSFSAQQDDRPPRGESSLHQSGGGGRERGSYEGHVMRSSAYTSALLSDLGRALPLLAVGAAVGVRVLGPRGGGAGGVARTARAVAERVAEAASPVSKLAEASRRAL